MTSGPFPSPGRRGSDSSRRRRPRYAGTHPREFAQRYKELAPEAYPAIHPHVRAQGRTPAGTHVPILVEEVLAGLTPRPGEVVADCTVGHGGHALTFLSRIGPTGRLIGLDVDEDELERARRRLVEAGWTANIRLHRSHFAGLGKVLAAEGLAGFDVIFADLGVSSMQIDDPSRGFSYKHDGPLDMRMDQRLPRTAADWLCALSEEELAAALDELADEPAHRRIARAIVRERASRPIGRTAQLVRVISSAATRREAHGAPDGSDLHPAARTFQALRILVNDELKGLEQILRIAPYCLRAGGRIGVISFHSGEDRRVEESFRRGLEVGLYSAITEQPIRPGPAERRDNPRSGSAKFRWADKLAMEG